MSSYAPVAVQVPKHCHACSGIMDPKTVNCPHCNVPQVISEFESDKRRMPVFILAVFLGVFGVHRFYVGKTTSGVFQLLTLGGFGIWALADMIIIGFGGFKDADERPIRTWT